MGQRHLHYYAGKGFFAFASEVKGLAALPDVPSKLALSTLARQLAVDGTRRKGATILQGIFGLEGGTIMRVSASGEITTRQYWVPRADPKHLNRDEAYYIKTYREVLTEAVGCRVRRARRPPALLLGGGFDSGAIAGLSSTALVDGTKLVCVTSVGSDPAHGVRKWSGILASHMPHLTMRYVTRDGIDALTDIERNFLRDAEPYSPNRYASEALYAAAAATGARVIMDGHGGDYTLNPRGTGWLARRLLLGEFRRVASELRAYRRHSRASWGHAIKSEILSQLTPAPLVRAWRRRRAGLSLFGPAAPIAPGLLSMAESRGLPIDTRAARRSRATVPQMVEVLRQQQSGHAIGGSLLAAAHGMEFTQPYHDRRVVELALAIPEELHVRNGRDRHLARVALADVYPPEYQARGRANDDLIPDFAEMVQRIRPRLLEEIERMEKNGRLSKLFDFSRMRRMLREGKSEVAARHAVRTLLYARFVEWFQRDNRP
jgi:asparagine synthase (glutamine-hydrolysing)